MLAPIALFCFNRPAHLSRALFALAQNVLATESELYIFCDGPRTKEEQKLTDAVRDVAASARGFKKLEIMTHESNLGCASSVRGGLQHMFERYEKLIVIEDDIICSPYTLSFLNCGLDKYVSEPVVFNIAAWSPPPGQMSLPTTYPYDSFFIPRFNCWGWASWRDRFELVDWDVDDYSTFSKLPCLQEAFNKGGHDLTVFLRQCMAGRGDGWAIKVDYARFKHGRLGLNPVHSYTTNIGMGSGAHCAKADIRFDNDITLALREPTMPDHIFVNDEVCAAYRKASRFQPTEYGLEVLRARLRCRDKKIGF